MPAKSTIPRICLTCGAAFDAQPSAVKRGHAKFCSKPCHIRAQIGGTRSEEFWKRVDRRGVADCWPWTSGCYPFGYGCFWYEKRRAGASRVAWELTFGPIPPGMWVLHRCDNPPCCNPSHLFLGTADDNNKDMAAKGRVAMGDRHGSKLHPELVPRGEQHGSRTKPESRARGLRSGMHTHPERRSLGDKNGARLHPDRLARGESVGAAKLKNSDVLDIRRRFALGGIPKLRLAKEYSVSHAAIRAIIARRTWAHLPA